MKRGRCVFRAPGTNHLPDDETCRLGFLALKLLGLNTYSSSITRETLAATHLRPRSELEAEQRECSPYKPRGPGGADHCGAGGSFHRSRQPPVWGRPALGASLTVSQAPTGLVGLA